MIIEASDCPTCAADFDEEVHVTTKSYDRDGTKSVKHEHNVRCANGHRFTVTNADYRRRIFWLSIPEVMGGGPMREEAIVGEAVCKCGDEIQPGQAYIPGDPPRHVWC